MSTQPNVLITGAAHGIGLRDGHRPGPARDSDRADRS